MAIGGLASAEAALQWTLDYTRERKAFGKAIADFQNTRFKLAEMATRSDRPGLRRPLPGAAPAGVSSTCRRRRWPSYWGTDLQCKVLDECVQLHGGYGFMWEYPMRPGVGGCAVQRIYAGTNEIMKEIIARSL